MAATSLSLNIFDKENDASCHLTSRTPHSKAPRLGSTSGDDVLMKPGQRNLSVGTPNANRSALHNVKNTPLKSAGFVKPEAGFKTPGPAFTFPANLFHSTVVRPKQRQTSSDSLDPLSRVAPPLPADAEDYEGEFVNPSERLTNCLSSLVRCTPFPFWGFPCISSTGSTSDDEDETSYLMNLNNRLDRPVPEKPPRTSRAQVQGRQVPMVEEEPIDVPSLEEEDLSSIHDQSKLKQH